MNLTQTVIQHVQAAFPGLYLCTVEPDDALRELQLMAHHQGWQCLTWDLDQGLQGTGIDPASPPITDPVTVLRMATAAHTNDGVLLVILRNFQRFLGSLDVIQAVEHQLQAGKLTHTHYLILAPVVQLPVELERSFVVLEHPLPTREQLAEVARGVLGPEDPVPDEEQLAPILTAAAGLTRQEAEGALALSLIRHQRFDAATLWELKARTLLQGGLLTLHRGGERFADLGGLDALKAFCRNSLRGSSEQARPKGVLLLSPPGCGKSQFCKALGTELGRPVLILDVGALMGSLVGQTEQRTRQALQTIDAMAPAIVMIDELEKAFAGTGNHQDSGVSARMFGTFLTWLNDHTSDVYVVCTSNDVSQLPPEFARSERFDAMFFIDLPTAGERQAIWQLVLAGHPRRADPCPDDADWTGAEIRACARLSRLLDLPLGEAAQFVVPLARTAAEQVARLRQWARGRCLSASVPGIYQAGTPTETSRRRLSRSSSHN